MEIFIDLTSVFHDSLKNISEFFYFDNRVQCFNHSFRLVYYTNMLYKRI